MTTPEICRTTCALPPPPRSAPETACAAEVSPPIHPVTVWVSDCVEHSLSLIERRALNFREGRLAISVQDGVDRDKRYQLIDTLLDRSVTASGLSGRELMHGVISGYLHEFARQTQLQLPPLNIANPLKPQPLAKEFWESQPRESFDHHRFPGVHHTARSYLALLREHFSEKQGSGTRTGRKAAWEATSELLRASIDAFYARGHEIFPDRQLCASIYNDHLFVIAFARRTFCAEDPLHQMRQAHI